MNADPVPNLAFQDILIRIPWLKKYIKSVFDFCVVFNNLKKLVTVPQVIEKKVKKLLLLLQFWGCLTPWIRIQPTNFMRIHADTQPDKRTKNNKQCCDYVDPHCLNANPDPGI
jgi:hypothetical protein